MMDAERLGLKQPDWERNLPHASDLNNLYKVLGDIAASSSENLNPTDDALAEKIITRNPAYQPGGDLYKPLVEALTANDTVLEQQTMNAGLEIAGSIIANAKNTRGIITGYLNACFEVDRLKIGLCGLNNSIEQEHLVLAFTRMALLDDIPANERSVRIALNVGEAVHRLSHNEDFFSWFMPKVQLIQQEITARFQTKHVAEQINPTSQESIEAYGGGDVLKADIAAFVSRTMLNRKYGVKAAYTEASVGGSWVYYDADDYTDILPVDIDPRFAAIVFHTPLTELKDLRLKSEVIHYANNAKTRIVTGAVAAMEPDARYVVGYDGELYADDSLLEPVRRLLTDKPGLYESLQAEIIANLHDLTSSAGTVEATKAPNVSTLSKKERDLYDPVLQLLAPRLKKIYSGLDPEEHGTRTVREHDVTWFVRKLPHGWKASPDATELAKRHNITLEPDETFVRKHRRGSGNEVQGHQISHQ